MAAWVVRCGRKGQEGALARFEDNSVASIGWEIGDLSQIDSREDINPNPPIGSHLGSWVGD